MDGAHNKSLLERHEEDKQQDRKERNHLIIGVIIFILMLPLDYIIIKKVIEYRENKQKESFPLILDSKPAQQNGVATSTEADAVTLQQNRPTQKTENNKTSDGWVEVDGKRYLINGRTITKVK